MPDMKQIHDFAVKWCDKFRDQNINYIDLVDHFMADDCVDLGFEMDCGHAFSEKYGQAANNYEALDRIIDDVTDIPLLGSAIYSQWRYFNHWAYDAAEILEPQNQAWFILSLSRLALLSGENLFIFQGTLKKIRIVSNNICYGPMPDSDDEVEQHLTINDEGRVWFSGYNFGHSGEGYEYVFDGNCKPDVINRIALDYHRVTKIKLQEVPEDATWEFVTWDYTEHLIIDRETETLEHIQNIGSGCKVSRKYEIEGGIESLLENFNAEDLFSHIEGNSDDVIDTPNETKDYKITIDYKKSPQRVIEGSYDKNGLPEDFADFAETVFEFIRFYGLGEVLAPSVYGKAKRRKSEYIFCSVTFDDGYKSYYYLTDDDSIEIGDFVLVPAGKDNHEAVVEVVNIEYFSEGNVPLPIEKTKRIIRKCTDDDFDLPEGT